MTRWWAGYVTATRFALLEQARNWLALAILVFFIPLWISVIYRLLPADGLLFFVRPAGRSVTIAGNILAQISGALQVIGLLVGFMMFLATTRSASFDRRLVQAGYPRLSLVGAKVTALVLAAAVVAVYTSMWMQLYWRPRQLVLLAASLFLVALIYGGIGIMLAAVVRNELAGVFLVIMTSFLDIGVQNPIANAAAASPALRVLPAFAAMQSAVTSVELSLIPYGYLALGLAWAVATAATGIAAFTVRTRSRRGNHTIDSTGPTMTDDITRNTRTRPYEAV